MIGARNVLVLDFGSYLMPDKNADAYKAVPKRKDGRPDARYRISRLWFRYLNEQNALAVPLYVAGADMALFQPEPWELPQ